ncbi:MAG: putative MFS-type transporter YcaD [Pseudomonadales bacterium]|nr:putative MFS-type transporter YcaD [Pseudomonadales bacterium]
MRAVVLSLWALFAGLALIVVGAGLQGTLLGVRASLSGFDTGVTGAVLACYYVGFLLGSWSTPRLIARVGPIRVFAALASLVSFAPLAHALFVDPLAWALVRLLSGACMVGVYIIAESWLNAEATNQNRGRLLSLYLIVCQGSMAGGQFLLQLGDPLGFELFVLISALCSLAVVPIALTRRAAPRHESIVPIRLAVLLRRVPLTLAGILLVSLTYGAFYAIGPVYALQAGFAHGQIAWFMAAAIVGSALLQWPVGMLSDRMDRRLVVLWASAAVCVVALLLAVLPAGLEWTVYGLMFVYGGLSFPLYGVFLSLAGDVLRGEELVAASSKVLLVNGTGSALGPVLVAWLMEAIDARAYLVFVALVHALVFGLVALHRLRTGAAGGQPLVHHVNAVPQGSVVAAAMAGRVAGET